MSLDSQIPFRILLGFRSDFCYSMVWSILESHQKWVKNYEERNEKGGIQKTNQHPYSKSNGDFSISPYYPSR